METADSRYVSVRRGGAAAAGSTLLLLCLLGVAACSTLSRPGTQAKPAAVEEDTYFVPVPSKERTVFSKSYQSGERYTVGVGQPMVGVKNYTVAERVARAIVLQDFEQNCAAAFGKGSKPCSSTPLDAVRGSLGDSFKVAGSISENGFVYYLIGLPLESGTAYVLADADGYLKPDSYVAWREGDDQRVNVRGTPVDMLEIEVPMELAGPLFSYETEDTLLTSGARYLSYELVYNGIGYDQRGPNFNVIYREYRRDGRQTPGYEHNLVFQSNHSVFDLLGMRIQVHAVTDDSISFTVVEDSLAG